MCVKGVVNSSMADAFFSRSCDPGLHSGAHIALFALHGTSETNAVAFHHVISKAAEAPSRGASIIAAHVFAET